MNENPISIFWYRRDLRLEDDHGLFHALNGKYPIVPVFIFNKNILDVLPDKKDKRVNFICRTLQNINDDLRQVHASLLIYREDPPSD